MLHSKAIFSPYLKMPAELKPDTQTFMFLEKGHAIESIEVGPDRKKMVSLFFGPGEFAIPCHLQYGILQSLDNAVGYNFTHGQIMHMLRKFPETHVYYREMRRRYQEKVADRIHTLTSMTGEQQFAHLRKHQPWVFELAKIKDIASYLAI
jgi:hypothetical protein